MANRYRILRVSTVVLMDALKSRADLQRGTYIDFHGEELFPAGSKIVSVHHDWERRVFGFLIEHESFAEVALGEEPPILDMMHWQRGFCCLVEPDSNGEQHVDSASTNI